MTFPMQNLFQAELEYEKDFERMRELYPREVAKIVAIISDRCDELEFEGSRIYDENPDRMMMEKEAHALYEKIKKELGDESKFGFFAMPYGCDDWLCGLVGVLFPDEIYKRRCRYRRSRRWW
jgi:hypothetical protein